MANKGHDPTRLDRLEGLVESLLNRHLGFEEEHKRLLIAHEALTGRIDRLAQPLTRSAAIARHRLRNRRRMTA